jgi:hypothetical protein
MWPALVRPRSTTTAPSRPALRSASNLSTRITPGRRATMEHDNGRFPRSLLLGRRVRHPAIPLRHRHGYAVDLHRGLPARLENTSREFPDRHDKKNRQPDAHRTPARIHRVRAGKPSRGVTTPVSHVYLLVSLTRPGPSGSPGPSRLCRGCSHPPQRSPDQAAASFTPPLRRQGNEGLPPPSDTAAPRGALSMRLSLLTEKSSWGAASSRVSPACSRNSFSCFASIRRLTTDPSCHPT